jgi:hypothetical protein
MRNLWRFVRIKKGRWRRSAWGTDLIDCAKANASKGVETAAKRCGYGQDVSTFEQELKAYVL